MPGQIIAVPGTNTIYATFQARIFDEDNTTLWRPWWVNGKRGPTTRDQHGWSLNGTGRWPAASGFFSDPASPSCLMIDRNMNGGLPTPFEPFHYGNPGCQSSKYIMGQCKDSGGSPIGGAVVQGFKTADDSYIGQTESDSLGQYELRCPNTPTDQHYLVAYVDTGTDLAGTTVNTLVPTWRDGSV